MCDAPCVFIRPATLGTRMIALIGTESSGEMGGGVYLAPNMLQCLAQYPAEISNT